jgi:hypothetical protein
MNILDVIEMGSHLIDLGWPPLGLEACIGRITGGNAYIGDASDRKVHPPNGGNAIAGRVYVPQGSTHAHPNVKH